jgi:hypothetical protein
MLPALSNANLLLPRLTVIFFFYSRLPAFARREVHDNNVYLLQAACGKSQDVTGLQLPGVLDDMFAYTGQLGAVFGDEAISLYLWAPTAQV